ncbi:MAG TPA: metal ABC transporter substrate-binding protein [Actinomycetota bacterium]|nr:metal ABC transporter substrate-binding protein [Actinomycetota bacterium]
MRRFLSLLAFALAAAGCSGPNSSGDGRPDVVAAFYPLAWAAEAVGGGDVVVTDLTPPGAEPHDLELTPGQVRQLAGASLVVYVGAGFQPAVEELAADRPAAALDVLADGGNDPHVWLDPVAMTEIVEEIAARLAEKSPARATAIERRAERTRRDLRALHDDFTAGLRGCERREFVVSHDAFGHLAERYDLEQIAISGLDPEAEPAPGRIAEVADLARDRGVTTIFFETLVSPAVAETIAGEAGLETEMLDPLETEPQEGDYLDGMRANLAALRRALECE